MMQLLRISAWYFACFYFLGVYGEHKVNLPSCGENRYGNEYFKRTIMRLLDPYSQKSSLNLASRVAGGAPVREGEFPWMAAITEGSDDFICGGTLINDEWVLTAAHCITPVLNGEKVTPSYLKKVTIYLGEHNNDKDIREASEIAVEVKKIVAHPMFNYDYITGNDIALIQLKRPVAFNEYIRPACIPDEEVPAGTRCHASGWGLNREGYSPSTLHGVELKLISYEKCSNKHEKDFLVNGVLCAKKLPGVKIGDACRGDSGGPLSCLIDGKFIVTGVVSYGIPCQLGQKTLPGVYTDIFYFREWIEDTMAEKHSTEDYDYGSETSNDDHAYDYQDTESENHDNGPGVYGENEVNLPSCGENRYGNEFFKRTIMRLLDPYSQKSSLNLASRVAGGAPVREGEFPWMAAMTEGSDFICGGTLINNEWVLTAAHCITPVENGEKVTSSYWKKITIYLGEHNNDKDIREASEIAVKVKKVVAHPMYNNYNLKNDIALIQLKRPVAFDEYIRPACIPDEEVPAGTRCHASGWGLNRQGETPSILHGVELKLISYEKCSNIHEKDFLVNGVLCAKRLPGVKIGDACRGDSGGPLSCLIDGKFIVTGIVSYGLLCQEGKTTLPGVYTDIFHFRQWIEDTLAGKYSTAGGADAQDYDYGSETSNDANAYDYYEDSDSENRDNTPDYYGEPSSHSWADIRQHFWDDLLRIWRLLTLKHEQDSAGGH